MDDDGTDAEATDVDAADAEAANVDGTVAMDAFLAGLPAVYVGVGALIRNAAGEVLIVNPTYKPGWEVPGGGMDPDEFPRETLRRELAEEIGFTIEPGRLLSVDFTLARPERPRPSIMYVYDCGILDARQQEQIVLPADELSEHRFVAPDALAGLLRGRLCRRILEALRQRELGGTADQENGHVPGTARLVPPEVAESLD